MRAAARHVMFFCPGRPQTAGSKTIVPTKAGPRVVDGGKKEVRERKKTWRGDLRDAAQGALPTFNWPLPMYEGPVSLQIVIVRRRPSDHLRTGRHAGQVKERCAALLPVERPDTVKIVRAAEDALTGVLWADDSQIVHHSLYKAFADQVGLTPVMEGLFVTATTCEMYHGPPVALRALRALSA